LSDLATVSFEQNTQPADNFETMLRATFGKEMCEVFLHPYNRKMWKRPLTELAPAGFQWTITKPVFDEVVRGALQGDRSFRAYNSNGWYPRPPRGATLRGMEVLSAALAKQAADLRLAHSVIGIDIGRREVHCLNASGELSFGYERAVCCTLPLQRLLGLVQPLPERLRTLHQDLKWNRVVMAAFRVRGPRPEGRGHWRYYSDESLLFNRLIYMHEFDPDTAPADGWSVMAEITEPHEWPMRNREELLTECLRDIVRTGEFPNGCEVIGQDCWAIDPAYVVFTAESQRAVEEITAYLREHDVEPLGRYGRWEYSSMGQVIRDGRRWARELIGTNEAQGGTKS
jgi:protoporphyrinogen oxidase